MSDTQDERTPLTSDGIVDLALELLKKLDDMSGELSLSNSESILIVCMFHEIERSKMTETYIEHRGD